MTDKLIKRKNELKEQLKQVEKEAALEVEEMGLVISEPQDLAKPERDTKFAHESAKLLMDIVKKNNWAKMLGGQSAHLQYEAWQTVGKYYGYTVRTGEAEEVTFGGVAGFKANAKVINEVTGIEVGGAEAYCMRDEGNWKTKPVFQLASMAQTRAGSKALRQILGFVVALAGYSPTPAEEMDGIYSKNVPQGIVEPVVRPQYSGLATPGQIKFIHDLLQQKHYKESSLLEKYEVTNITQLTFDQASDIINNLKKLPVAKAKPVQPEEYDFDEIEQGIAKLSN